MKKTYLGILFGIVAGILDVLPMLLQGLSWDANLSAFSLWIVSGFLIASTNLKLHASWKGILISFLVLLPSAVLIAWQDIFALVPILVMTFILGASLGYVIERFA